jgi:hypothetical protein
VQGGLTQIPHSVKIDTDCAHCGQALHLQIDSRLNFQVAEAQAQVRVFIPLVDFKTLADPSIIDAF